jgi:hypothetical protein
VLRLLILGGTEWSGKDASGSSCGRPRPARRHCISISFDDPLGRLSRPAPPTSARAPQVSVGCEIRRRAGADGAVPITNQHEEDELRFARDDLFEKLNTLNAGIKSLVTFGVMGLIVLIFIAVSIAISVRRGAVPT